MRATWLTDIHLNLVDDTEALGRCPLREPGERDYGNPTVQATWELTAARTR